MTGAAAALLGLLLAGCGARRPEPVQAAEPAPPAIEPSSHHEPHPALEPGPASASPEHASPEHASQPPTASHRFDDAERWSKIFDDPARDAWQRPRELVAWLALAPDEVVVDLGTGTGYLVPHLARAVPRGRVIAVDVEPALLRFVEKRAASEKLANVATRLAELDDPKLAEPLDLVLLVDAYHHIGNRTAYFKRLSRLLSARGRVVVVDFKLGKFPIGPPDSHKLAPETVESEFLLGGFKRCSSWDGLQYQYVLSFALRCPSN
jgi:SAM-dependent methyltransferase